MTEFISNGADINLPDDYAIGMFFSKKTQMLRTKFFVIRSFSKWRTNVILWSTTPPWSVSFNNFSTSQTLQILNKIITKFVGPFQLNCTRLLFKYFWGLMVVLLIKGISLLSHKSFKELFTSITLLFQLSLRGIILEILTLSLLSFTFFANDTIDSAILFVFFYLMEQCLPRHQISDHLDCCLWYKVSGSLSYNLP